MSKRRSGQDLNGVILRRTPNYGDVRQQGWCVFCGVHQPDSRDHVPSRVFLDDPLPEALSTVPACRECNVSFSEDEEYVACLIECAAVGSVQSINRDKIRRILQHSPALSRRLEMAFHDQNGQLIIDAEAKRVNRVLVKLAQGHTAFDLNEPRLDEPSGVYWAPLSSLTSEVRQHFETPPESSIMPEVGSRASLVVEQFPGASIWISVQQGRYRYVTSVGDQIVIRIVIGEYLAGEVIW